MTFGQYLRPSKQHMPVYEYIAPEAFEKYRSLGMEMVGSQHLALTSCFALLSLIYVYM